MLKFRKNREIYQISDLSSYLMLLDMRMDRILWKKYEKFPRKYEKSPKKYKKHLKSTNKYEKKYENAKSAPKSMKKSVNSHFFS